MPQRSSSLLARVRAALNSSLFVSTLFALGPGGSGARASTWIGNSSNTFNNPANWGGVGPVSVVTVDFSGATLALGQTYLGGFFLDANVSDSLLNNATFVFTGLNGATVQYDGLVTVATATFATGTVTNGEVMEFSVVAVPELGSACLVLFGGLGLALQRRKRTGA